MCPRFAVCPDRRARVLERLYASDLHGYEVLLNYFTRISLRQPCRWFLSRPGVRPQSAADSLIDDVLVFSAAAAVVNFHLLPALILFGSYGVFRLHELQVTYRTALARLKFDFARVAAFAIASLLFVVFNPQFATMRNALDQQWVPRVRFRVSAARRACLDLQPRHRLGRHLLDLRSCAGICAFAALPSRSPHSAS